LGDELPVAVLWLTDRNVLVKRQTRAVAGQDFRMSRAKSNQQKWFVFSDSAAAFGIGRLLEDFRLLDRR
jgi:hypothetical protein